MSRRFGPSPVPSRTESASAAATPRLLTTGVCHQLGALRIQYTIVAYVQYNQKTELEKYRYKMITFKKTVLAQKGIIVI